VQQAENVRKARAHFLIGLGYLGQGKQAQAREEFASASRLDVNHLGARTMLAELRQGR
jgi:Tfp pilus assembly protein PilF